MELRFRFCQKSGFGSGSSWTFSREESRETTSVGLYRSVCVFYLVLFLIVFFSYFFMGCYIL